MAEHSSATPAAATKPVRVGLRNESKCDFEGRVPLVPADLRPLIADGRLQLVLQPSLRRCIPAAEFEAVGASVNSDLSDCDIIMGIKEVPIPELLPNKTYLYFSHVIKGQPYNMAMLRRLMELKCTLLDYEKITNDHGTRLVAFGKQAGQSGAINAFYALNRRLAALGQPNPFEICKQAKDYPDFAAAKADLRRVGEAILADGLPDLLVPFLIGVTGRGNVASGVLDILAAVPCVVEWKPAEVLENIQAGRFDFKHIYMVVLDAGDLYELKDAPDPAAFTFAAFNADPSAYVSTIPRYLPHFTIFMNAVFWREEFPRYITKAELKALWEKRQVRLVVIADITCDIEGSVEVTVKSTHPVDPCYVYDPVTQQAADGFDGDGVVIMAVDILPAEQPLESSRAFSTALIPHMPALLAADFRVPFEALQLPPVWHRACILYQGELTPSYRYLQPHVEKHGHAEH